MPEVLLKCWKGFELRSAHLPVRFPRRGGGLLLGRGLSRCKGVAVRGLQGTGGHCGLRETA